MSQRIALATAVALTAFVLVLVAGIATRLTSAQPEAAAVATVVPSTAAAPGQSVQAVIAERDAAYQKALAEANARIEAANAQVREANAQLEQANTQPAAAVAPVAPVVAAPAAAAPTEAPPAAPTYPVSAEQAVVIAQGVAYGTTASKAPELVSLQGTPAYEVTFPQGQVYVDANSGAVLANSIPAPAPPAPRYEEHEDEEHDDEEYEHEHEEHEAREHEGGGDDD